MLELDDIEGVSDAALALTWGDLSPVPWVRLSSHVRHSPADAYTYVTLVADVGEHDILVPFSRGKRVRRAATLVEETFFLDDTSIRKSGDAASLVTPKVRETARVMSYRLREHDPRIGEVVGDGATRNLLRRCLLFDPPRMRPPEWKGNAGLDAVPCPFCQDGFGSGYPAMWGGGNLLWVHPSCWLAAAL